nr:aminoacyl--tRNA ligase-related protein [Rhizobium laguerreae]
MDVKPLTTSIKVARETGTVLNIYHVNSLVHWEEREIHLRDHMIGFFSQEVRSFLRSVNPAWDVRRVEAPALMPRSLVSSAYSNADIWIQEQLSTSDIALVLRPETTPSTYVYMQHILGNHSKTRLPLCVWQAGRSYRREQEQPSKHMRLKEFWQLEFQCAFTADSGNDYHAACLEPVRRMIASLIHLPTRIVPSDRLPAYSEVTVDIEVDNADNWMEVCSISRRTDFPQRYQSQPKKGAAVDHDVLVLEIAIGLDRCLYNWNIAADR